MKYDLPYICMAIYALFLNGVPGSPASPGRFSGRGGVQPAGWDIAHISIFKT